MTAFNFRPLVAGLTLALAAAGSTGMAVAATSDASTTGAATPSATSPRGDHAGKPGKHQDGRHGRMMMRDGIMIPGLGPLSKAQVESLKLTSAQQAKVDTARTASRALHDKMRDAGKSRHDLLASQLKANKLDPRALSDESGKGREQFTAERGQVRDQWLAVWDSLTDAQKGQVTEIVKVRQARHDEMKQKRMQRGDVAPPPATGA